MQGQTVKIGGGQGSANLPLSGQEEIEVAGTVLLTEGFVAESHLEDFLNCKDKLRWMNMIYLDTMAITSTSLQPRLQSGLSSRWEQATGAKIICWDLSPIKANDNFIPNSDWQNICQQDVRNTWRSSDNSVHHPAQCSVSDSLGPGLLQRFPLDQGNWAVAGLGLDEKLSSESAGQEMCCNEVRDVETFIIETRWLHFSSPTRSCPSHSNKNYSFIDKVPTNPKMRLPSSLTSLIAVYHLPPTQ